MVNLIKRDLILQKKLLWLYIPFILFFVVTWSSPFLIFTMAALYIPFNAYAYDEEVESDKLLNSLPYTRLEIITARYVGAVFYTALSIILVSFTLLIFNKTFSIADIIIGASLFLALAAFTFPLFQIFKQGNITTIIIIALVIVLGLASYFSEFLSKLESILLMDSNGLSSLLPIILALSILIIYVLSWLTTYLIYNKKDF